MLNEALQLPESLLPFINGNQLAIDCGISSSKIVFSVQLENHEQVFRSLGLLNEELKTVLLEIQETFGQKVFEKIFVVGFKNLWAKTVVKSVFDADANVVEEISALSNGVQLISDNFQLSEIEIKIEESLHLYEKYKINFANPLWNKLTYIGMPARHFRSQGFDHSRLMGLIDVSKRNFLMQDETNCKIVLFLQAMKFPSTDDANPNKGILKFPNIMILAGSTIKYYLLNNDRTAKLINYSMFAGETLKGLFKCLVDSNNFNENILLASKGNREKTDTQIWEMISDNTNSPYGENPLNLPILSFGKCADYNKDKEYFNSNDILDSLSFVFLNETNNQMHKLCKAFKINHVYVCGGIFNSPIYTQYFQFGVTYIPNQIETKILNVDYILALGALMK